MTAKANSCNKLSVPVESSEYLSELWDFWRDIEALLKRERALHKHEGIESNYHQIYNSNNINISYNLVEYLDAFAIKFAFVTMDANSLKHNVLTKAIEFRKDKEVPELLPKFMVGLTHRLIYKHTTLYVNAN